MLHPLVALVMLAVVTAGCDGDGVTLVRAHNASAYDYDELQVRDEHYGTLAAGAFTDYRDFGTAYRYDYVRLLIDGEELVLQPIDFVGETPLGDGHFTYDIGIYEDLGGKQITITAVED